jgi:hypothetical protein
MLNFKKKFTYNKSDSVMKYVFLHKREDLIRRIANGLQISLNALRDGLLENKIGSLKTSQLVRDDELKKND